ncbi:class I SAM-dependent methyltransferase [Nodosilinea sp. LEGE 07088]|uniref:class I SAM-dependent methyltransferase n=1 Tax=Nodosilinea sp. LEGE 07088 TaxID=2777968 RepID=UPI0018806A36|nr:class I SAM-dependent methyltransferase [Nodosilinea sp. LEGE 07088]MBE9135944.1 class I SAM-dependent methyltransferase [Nodosilinea sp. LEGE 07088]
MIKSQFKNIQFVDRIDLLRSLCHERSVLHLGATDSPETIGAANANRLLHLQIDSVAKQLVGVDIDREMIQWLANNYGVKSIFYGNVEKIEDYPSGEFDVIVAGEILEHLNNPGQALGNIRRIMQTHTQLVVTVPNAYSLKGFIRACLGYELIHPDHLLHHSPHTLKVLLKRFGFSIECVFSFANGGQGIAASIANCFLRFNPQLAEGIGIISRAV